MKDVIVLIPVYKSDFTHEEEYSLYRCIDVLGSYDIGFVCPFSLPELDVGKKHSIVTYRFHDCFFESTSSYNQLMLSEELYRAFEDYQYILIHQLDALVFSNRLEEFIRLDYDYIGAPWIHGAKFWAKNFGTGVGRYAAFLYNKIHQIIYEDLLYVGNGGLSLRKVSSFIDTLNRFSKMSSTYQENEDAFFSWIGKNYPQLFNVAPVNVALKFSFEMFPRRCYEMNNHEIPFGCHAWKKYDPDFIDELIARSEWRE